MPYVLANDLSDDVCRTIGLEDLLGNYPVRLAAKITGFEIPVLGLIQGWPHPLRTKDLREGEFERIELQYK